VSTYIGAMEADEEVGNARIEQALNEAHETDNGQSGRTSTKAPTHRRTRRTQEGSSVV
jgi:hypothetical protein